MKESMMRGVVCVGMTRDVEAYKGVGAGVGGDGRGDSIRTHKIRSNITTIISASGYHMKLLYRMSRINTLLGCRNGMYPRV